MAAYPSFAQTPESARNDVDDLVIDRAANGSVKLRSMFTTAKATFKIRHELTGTDLATLRTFYNTNRLLTFTFVWNKDGTTYTCLFSGPIQEVGNIGPDWTLVETSMVQQ